MELMPMEVGTLGFISQSTVRACKKLGAWSNELRALEDVALRASHVLSRAEVAWVVRGAATALEAAGRRPCSVSEAAKGATCRRDAG